MRCKLISIMLITLPLFASTTGLNDIQKQEVRDLIQETLKADPKIIINSIVEFRKQQMQEYQKTTEKNIKQYSNKIFNTNNNLVFGNPKAETTIVEFMDYNCGHCKALAKTLESITKTNDNVKVVVKDLPLFGESSMLAAKASIAAYNQNKFADFHHAVLALEKQPNQENITAIAKQLNLDINKFNTDLNSKETMAYIDENINLAKNLKIMATPAMIIGTPENYKFVAGAIPKESLNEIISQMK